MLLWRTREPLSVDSHVSHHLASVGFFLKRFLLTITRHLINVESRLQKLEALFGRILPDVDLDDALSSPALSSAQYGSRHLWINNFSTTGEPRATTVALASETLPQTVDGFDWKEQATDVTELADGMAALSVEPSGVGYLDMCCLYAITRDQWNNHHLRVHFECRISSSTFRLQSG
jgi:hypothetical protein